MSEMLESDSDAERREHVLRFYQPRKPRGEDSSSEEGVTPSAPDSSDDGASPRGEDSSSEEGVTSSAPDSSDDGASPRGEDSSSEEGVTSTAPDSSDDGASPPSRGAKRASSDDSDDSEGGAVKRGRRGEARGPTQPQGGGDGGGGGGGGGKLAEVAEEGIITGADGGGPRGKQGKRARGEADIQQVHYTQLPSDSPFASTSDAAYTIKFKVAITSWATRAESDEDYTHFDSFSSEDGHSLVTAFPVQRDSLLVAKAGVWALEANFLRVLDACKSAAARIGVGPEIYLPELRRLAPFVCSKDAAGLFERAFSPAHFERAFADARGEAPWSECVDTMITLSAAHDRYIFEAVGGAAITVAGDIWYNAFNKHAVCLTAEDVDLLKSLLHGSVEPTPASLGKLFAAVASSRYRYGCCTDAKYILYKLDGGIYDRSVNEASMNSDVQNVLNAALTEIKLAFCYTCNERPPVVPPPTMYGPNGLPPAHDADTGIAGLPTGNPERLVLHNALLSIVNDVARGPCTWSKVGLLCTPCLKKRTDAKTQVVKNARGWLMSKSWLEKRGLPSPETVYYTMDRNPALLGFDDGVFYVDDKDVTKWRFYRRGSIPTEWLVSKSVGYNFPGDDTGEPLTEAQRDQMAAFIARIFETTFADLETRAQIKDACGALLRGGSGLVKKIIFFVGRGGNNNKSGIIKMLEEALGKYATTADRSLVYNSTDVAAGAATPEIESVVESRAVAVHEAEPPRGPSGRGGGALLPLNAGMCKKLSGGDKLKFRGLYKGFQETVSLFKLILLANKPPLISGDDDPLFDRTYPIDFDSQFLSAKVMAERGLQLGPTVHLACPEGEMIEYYKDNRHIIMLLCISFAKDLCKRKWVLSPVSSRSATAQALDGAKVSRYVLDYVTDTFVRTAGSFDGKHGFTDEQKHQQFYSLSRLADEMRNKMKMDTEWSSRVSEVNVQMLENILKTSGFKVVAMVGKKSYRNFYEGGTRDRYTNIGKRVLKAVADATWKDPQAVGGDDEDGGDDGGDA
jgi:hypothetical protein